MNENVDRRPSRILAAACVCALGALALMSWSLFDPRPLPVIAAMSVGQALGTLSFLAFVYVVAMDLRQRRTPATPTSSPPTSSPPSSISSDD
jgi:hypothetical protein